MATLKVTAGPQQGQTVELNVGRFVIGRTPDCDFLLKTDQASRRHACLYNSDGRWRLQDMQSSNGTFLNGKRIEDSPLLPGDTITIGDYKFVFEDAEAAADESVVEEEVVVRDKPAAAPAAPAPVVDGQIAEMVRQMSDRTKRIEKEISKVIIGQKEIVWQMLTAIISGGHVLMIGMPGLAKTTLIRTLSDVLDMQFRRIQFTPDLMPSDITGTDVMEVDETSGKKNLRFIKGPIFCNILLADEINRTPPKTQAALLEAMQEHRVTAAGHTYQLTLPFFVLATQNPLEQEGTYPLPEAQLDRCMFSIYIDYPTEEEEELIGKTTTMQKKPDLNKVMSGAQVLELQSVVRNMPISDHVIKYATRLARASRPGDKRAPDFIKKWIHCGAGPRATQYLIVGAKAHAVVGGRLLVNTDDVRAVARPIMRHRMFTNFTADAEGVDTDKIVQMLLEAVPEPGEKDY
ncbi:MAG: AAA family ATPase [Verrucomicrobia bacterium]|nr:AAA family ATPase [Verrucomicrobiota bacterium]